MKTKLSLAGFTAAALLLPAVPTIAQMTGTSHPETLEDTIVATPAQAATPHYVKPSPAVPYTGASASAAATYQAYPAATPVNAAQPSYASEATIQRRTPQQPAFDPDANIVTEAPIVRPGELGEGTILHAQLQTPLSTRDTRVGDTFLATLLLPVSNHGVVLLPAGSQIKGRVSAVHGGRRIAGPASIRLQPDSITLPDGTVHRLHAEVIDVDNYTDSRVNSEGTIVNSEHPKATLAAVGLTTGSATVAGAVIGGGVGAAVGAVVGAGAGTIWWLKRDIQQQLPVGTGLVFSLDETLNMNPATNATATFQPTPTPGN